MFNLKVDFQSSKRLPALFIFKDKVNKAFYFNLVHNFNCNFCNDIYYGKHIYHFKVRARNHLSTISLTRWNLKHQKEGAILYDILRTVYKPSFGNFETR